MMCGAFGLLYTALESVWIPRTLRQATTSKELQHPPAALQLCGAADFQRRIPWKLGSHSTDAVKHLGSDRLWSNPEKKKVSQQHTC